jgi:2-C-methyl-D-erythritol 2,4-cyclodiphosphate synthase
MNMRIGFGYDVHAFAEGRALWLGGVRIEHPVGLLGHSDADVLIHAICDALLGAAGLRDIGFHFPDSDETYKDIDSKKILQKTMALLRGAGYELGNIDSTIVAEQPKLNPYIPLMQKTLADTIGVVESAVSIKATTSERLGFTGRSEGIAAYASVLIVR